VTSVRLSTLIGITLALVGPGIVALASARVADASASLALHTIFLLLFMCVVGAVAAIALRAEHLSVTQVGFGRLSWATPLRAVLLALFFIFVFGPLAAAVLAKLQVGSFEIGRSQFAQLPTWYFTLTIILVAAGEEWLYRGYAIERLETVVGNTWCAAGISLLAFVLAHLPIWGWGVALTTLVSGGILTVLYVRYRDVAFLMLAHVATDLYGLVVAPGHH
jgi:membrane protease YdiL (CAAX protease family)